MTQVNVDTVIKGYVALRDKRAILRKEYKESDAVLEEKMDKCKAFILNNMNMTGADQLGSSNGTAYRKLKFKASAEDWHVAWGWMAENNRLDMMQKRLSLKALEEYYEETGEYPPAVNVSSEYDVIVRRK